MYNLFFRKTSDNIYHSMLHDGGMCALSCCRERTMIVFCYCCPYFCSWWWLQYNLDVHEEVCGRVVKSLGNKKKCWAVMELFVNIYLYEFILFGMCVFIVSVCVN